MKKYLKIVIKVCEFDEADVVRTSGGNGGESDLPFESGENETPFVPFN